MTKGFKAVYLVFCLAIAFAVWMLGYGAGLHLFYGDGRILDTTIRSNPFAPIQQFWAYSDNPTLQKVALGSLVPAFVIAAIAAYLGLRPVTSPLGDAAFQDVTGLRTGKWFGKKGHIFGRFGGKILRAKDDRHHLIIGPTRSGKGAGYVIPNALMHEGSMIVTDLKGEVFRATAGYRKKNGSQVFIFAPGSECTNSYNPLDFVRPERGNRTTDIQNIASILVPENTESENSVWQAIAQNVIAGAISYMLESPFYHDRRNLGEINSFFNSGVDLQALMKHIKEKEPNLSKFTVESFNSYISLSDRAAASALLDIQKAMRPFKNERVVAATNFTDMDLRAMKRRPITIYLAPNITDITLLRPLLTLFVQQVMNILTLEHDPNSVPVYFLLDEFRQLKRMDEIMTKLPYVAGYNIKLAFIIQDLKNLDEIYGETSRHSLLGNCGYQLILGANDQATADYASRALGKRTIRYSSESRTIEIMGLPRRTKVEQIRERDLMMSQEVRQMPENRMILLVEGQRPIFAEKLRFFNTQPFKAAEAYAQAHIPSVPDIEYLPSKPVPATTAEYENAGNAAPVAEPSPAVQTNTPEAVPARKEPEKQIPATEAPEPTEVIAPAASPTTRTVNPAALTLKAKATPAPRPKAPRKRNSAASDDIARREEIEALHSLAAQRLREQVEKNSVGKNPTKRKNIMDVFAATVPDPETA